MTREQYEQLRSIPAAVYRRILDMTEPDRSEAARIAVAYAAIAAKQCPAPFFSDLGRFLERTAGTDTVRHALESLLTANDLPLIRKLARHFAQDELQAFVLFSASSAGKITQSVHSLLPGIARLGASVLGPERTHTVADIGSGSGEFIVRAFPTLGDRPVVAFETKREDAAAATLRCALLGPNYRVLSRDVIDDPGDGRFDRVFVHPHPDEQKGRVTSSVCPACPDTTPQNVSMAQIWIAVGAAARLLKPGGKAFILMPAVVLGQRLDSAIRGSYIKSGLVESVVLLPDGIMPETNSSCAVLVLSSDNTSVQMVDARGLVPRRGREHLVDEEGIERIVECLDQSGGHSGRVDMGRLEEADWSLLPTRYLNETVIPDGRPLEQICTRIERGAQISVAKLDELRSDTPTNSRYLRIADIEDGIVRADASAEYLKELPESTMKRCIRNGTIVLSRQGTPSYKSGVAYVAEDQSVLAPGNVYLIDVDPEIADPHFLQAFFQSPAGAASLKRLGGASVVSPIALADLKKLIVPVPPLEVQREVARAYQEASENCIRLRSELRESCEYLAGVYDDVCGTPEHFSEP